MHYIVQTKLKGRTEWDDCGRLETPSGSEPLAFKVEGLKEKSEVQFRVVAVNKAGPSPASEPTKMHLVKHRKRKFSPKCVTLVTLTKYFCDRCLRFVSQKHGRKNMTNSAQVSLTKSLINSSNGD